MADDEHRVAHKCKNTEGSDMANQKIPEEAIRKLEQEGLVDMYPRRGAQVSGITEKALADAQGVV